MQLGTKEDPIIWNVQYAAPPTVLRYCKKCGKKREFICSREFRVNAQQKALDIWLIYKCTQCNATWNSTIFSRVSPQRIGTGLLERFHRNDADLAMQYAMDHTLLHRNGAEMKLPSYEIVGEQVSLEQEVSISIQSRFLLPIKLSAILRTKLDISQREFEVLLTEDRIKSSTGQDLRKCRLSAPETVITITT